MSDFNLTDLIAEAADNAGPEASDIAAKVEPLIPESERHAVFLMLLARYIVSTRPRLANVLARPPAPTNVKPARSAKVAAYQEHARLLRVMVAVGGGQTKWMADCTYIDLCAAAETRRRHAADTIAGAEEFEALAALVKRRKVETVGKLPKADLDAFLSSRRAAA